MVLLGSGASPMPNVHCLTKAILTGEYSFSRGKLIEGLNQEGETVRAFLNYLCKETNAQDYEELAFDLSGLLKQIGTGQNPSIQAFYNQVLAAIRSDESLRLPPGFEDRSESENLGKLLDLADSWIRQVILTVLTKSADAPAEHERKSAPKHDLKRPLISFFECLGVPKSSLWICTLNYDLEIERALCSLNCKDYVTGFAQCGTPEEIFKPKSLLASSIKSKLLKLHGSVDWFDGDNGYVKLATPPRYDFRGNFSPVLLAGTSNKLEAYSFYLFPWIWAEFQFQLLKTRRIICSGYGFKDFGVNSRLLGWLQSFPDSRILIIHPDPDKLIDECKASPIGIIRHFFRRPSADLVPEYRNNPIINPRESNLEIITCGDEIKSTSKQIVLLKSGFEDAWQHGDTLNQFCREG